MTSHKDYLGDTLQMVERAREDVYFRQLDSQLIARMRERTEHEEASEAAPPLRPPFTPILVPVDFSAYSAEALEKAADIAARFDSSVIILHVTSAELGVQALADRLGKQGGDIPKLGTEELQAACGQVMEGVTGPQLERDYEVLQAFLPDRLSRHRVELRVVFGRPFERIVETAVAAEAALIVMGTHGRTGLERVAVGSVAERVVRLAPCPVLTVKGPSQESRSWLEDLYASFLRTGT